jgi:pyruvate/2-oxoglutarate dehydrogenase complex dihydrolipoamide acyltransferase (E2) component
MIDVKVPKWGLTMEDATVVEWLKSVGDTVEKGEEIVELESDKTLARVEAPDSGILGEILCEVDDLVLVEQVIARIYRPKK